MVATLDPTTVTGPARKDAIKPFQNCARAALTPAGYPEKSNPKTMNKSMVVLILFILVIYVTMDYEPIAALLVELFPTRILYSSMSLPITSAMAVLEGSFRPRRSRWSRRRATFTTGYGIVLSSPC